MQSPPQRRWNFPALNSGANGMDGYYYEDVQGQLRGPTTLQVLFVLKTLGLITSETLVQQGVEGTSTPLHHLEPKPIQPNSISSSVATGIASVSPRTVNRWGCIARTYFTLAQFACLLAALLVPFQTLANIAENVSRADELRQWVAYLFIFIAWILDISFFASLFFVFEHVKRRGL